MNKKLIAGLGNPGAAYRNTRHNVGFMLLGLLAEAWKIPMQSEKHQSIFGQGDVEGWRVFLVAPQTFMNNSGDSLALWVKKEGLDPAKDLLVVCDEMQLPLGKLRVRPEGSSGSHNGLASVIERLGTPQFARLRIGIGKPADASEWADYVLKSFKPEEREALGPVFERAMQGCEVWLKEPSFEKLMSKVNG